MGTQRTTFEKLQRDRAKKAKALAKREKRQERASSQAEGAELTTTVEPGEGELSAAELLAEVERTHQLFEAGSMGLEEFEEKKAELFARLPVD